MSEKRILLLGGKHRRLAIDRTTLILIILLSIFLCTELPQGFQFVFLANNISMKLCKFYGKSMINYDKFVINLIGALKIIFFLFFF